MRGMKGMRGERQRRRRRSRRRGGSRDRDKRRKMKSRSIINDCIRAQPSTEIEFGVVPSTSKSGRAYKQPLRIHNPGDASVRLSCYVSSSEPQVRRK